MKKIFFAVMLLFSLGVYAVNQSALPGHGENTTDMVYCEKCGKFVPVAGACSQTSGDTCDRQTTGKILKGALGSSDEGPAKVLPSGGNTSDAPNSHGASQ
jgi:hypothetical protein